MFPFGEKHKAAEISVDRVTEVAPRVVPSSEQHFSMSTSGENTETAAISMLYVDMLQLHLYIRPCHEKIQHVFPI